MSTELTKYLDKVAIQGIDDTGKVQMALYNNRHSNNIKNALSGLNVTDNIQFSYSDEVAKDMKCLSLDPDTLINFETYKKPLPSCFECIYGPNGDSSSGCQILIEVFRNRKKDIRSTSFTAIGNSDRELPTHYGFEENKEVVNLGAHLSPQIQGAIFDYVEQRGNMPWTEVLADNLFEEAIGVIGMPDFFSKGTKAIDYFNNYRDMVFNRFHTIPNTIKPSPWLKMIREFGLFRVVEEVINRFETIVQISDIYSARQVGDCLHSILSQTTGGRSTGDAFSTKYQEASPLGLNEGLIKCPGRVLGNATISCLALNSNLARTNNFSIPDGAFVPLIKRNIKQENEIVSIRDMSQLYDSIMDQR